MNQVILIGRLTKDAELFKSSSDGSSITKFNIAIDTGIDANGNKLTSFFTICAFKNNADVVVKYCRKGDRIGVVGKLQQRTYTNKNGVNVNVVEVIANQIDLLEPKREEPKQNVEPEIDDLFEPTPLPTKQEQETKKIIINDDDLPF